MKEYNNMRGDGLPSSIYKDILLYIFIAISKLIITVAAGRLNYFLLRKNRIGMVTLIILFYIMILLAVIDVGIGIN